MSEKSFRLKLRDFVRELRRRKVIRAMLAYAVAGIGIAEGAAIFLPPLGVPDWVPNTISVIVVLGFPVAMVLSWVFDIVPDEAVKTESADNDTSADTGSEGSKLRSASRMEGQHLGHYDIQDRLGVGGMGLFTKLLIPA